MAKGRLVFPILGLLCAGWPAQASLSYQTSESSFSNRATVTDGLTLSSLITFTSADLMTVGGVTDDEYVDITDGIEFFAYNSNGTTPESFTVSNGTLYAGDGDSIEIVFTSASIDGFGFSFTTTASSDNLCEGLNVGGGGNCSNNVFISNGGTGFMGALNDSALPATSLPTLWLYPLTSSPDTDLEGYYLAGPADEAPEGGTLITLGCGLVVVGTMRMRKGRGGR